MSSAFLSAAMPAQSWANCSEVMRGLLVELMAFNDRSDTFGNEIADGRPARNPLADFGGGEVDAPKQARKRMRPRLVTAAEDDEPDEPPEVVDAMPGLEL